MNIQHERTIGTTTLTLELDEEERPIFFWLLREGAQSILHGKASDTNKIMAGELHARLKELNGGRL